MYNIFHKNNYILIYYNALLSTVYKQKDFICNNY